MKTIIFILSLFISISCMAENFVYGFLDTSEYKLLDNCICINDGAGWEQCYGGTDCVKRIPAIPKSECMNLKIIVGELEKRIKALELINELKRLEG